MRPNRRVAVVGAGISGLATAYWLKNNDRDVTVFESAHRVGGTIVTEESDGFLLDLGPNSALETTQALKDLIRHLGIEDRRAYANEASNNRYVLKRGQLQALPMSPPAFLKTRLFSTRAKFRLLKEPFVAPTDGSDISLADLVRYRLGNEILDYAITPFVAGVYAGDPENLSAPAAFPKLYALEQKYGSFIKGAIKGARERKKRGEVAKDRAKLFSFSNGMEILPRALESALGENIRLNASISQVEKKEHQLDLHVAEEGKERVESFDQVVLSVPTDSLAGILKNVAPGLSERVGAVLYPPVAVIFTGFKTEHVARELDGFGFLVPSVERRKILGSIWNSTIFPGRAPEGYVALTTFVGGTRRPDDVAL
ncbi:MAG: protoporphyrinogen oxidase, partial [Candidatus Krumholzibacteria bacterium]|nr:protoporphyrinogen oxidase [Candidatus Krumholzibacteria bacterium]